MSLSKTIPVTPHWAIISETSKTVYTPGDERSRTHPGHGYPESWETITSINYQAFNTEEALQNALRFQRPDAVFRVLWVEPAKVETHTVVKVSR